MPNNEKTDKVQKSAAKNKQTKRSVKQSKTAKNQKNTTSKNEKALPKKSNARGAQDAERKRTAQKKTNQKKRSSSNSKKNRKKNVKSVKIGFLGGLNEIGKNITVYEFENDIVIVDCGLAFPEADMLGVDLVIVQQRLVAADHALPLVFADAGLNLLDRKVQHHRYFFHIHPCVAAENLQNLIHKGAPFIP